MGESFTLSFSYANQGWGLNNKEKTKGIQAVV